MVGKGRVYIYIYIYIYYRVQPIVDSIKTTRNEIQSNTYYVQYLKNQQVSKRQRTDVAKRATAARDKKAEDERPTAKHEPSMQPELNMISKERERILSENEQIKKKKQDITKQFPNT